MMSVYFGDFKTGRLKRLQYLGYEILLLALSFGFMIAVVLAIGAGEHIMGGNLQQAQAELAARFGGVAIAVVGLFYFTLFVAKLNIMAKRVRDIGLSGWWVVLTVVLLAGLLGNYHQTQSGSSLMGLVVLLLLFIPSDAIGGKQ